MRSLILESSTNAKSLTLVESSLSQPKKGEVRVKITSAGLNRGDLLYTQNRYFIKPNSGSRIGFEGAGVIECIGQGTETSFNVGDRVGISPMGFDVSTQGCLAEYGTYPVDALFYSPTGLNDEDTGAIWMAYLTAWGGLVDAGGLKKGESVVITAASSSVGIAAIQIANMLGATPIAVTTSDKKAKTLIELGAKHVITQPSNHDTNTLKSQINHYVEHIKSFTDNHGPDLASDAVAGPTSPAVIKASKREGRIIIHGMLDRLPMDIHAGVIMKRLLTLKGYTVDQTLSHNANKAIAIKAIRSGFKDQQLTPIIAKHFSLGQFDQAFTFLQSNQHIGKIVITP